MPSAEARVRSTGTTRHMAAEDTSSPEVVVTKDVRACAVSERAFSGSGRFVSAVKRRRCGTRYRVIDSSVSFLGLTMMRERRQFATSFARPMSWRQPSISSKVRVMRGSLGARERDALVRSMVQARIVFLAHGREVSDSRR